MNCPPPTACRPLNAKQLGDIARSPRLTGRERRLVATAIASLHERDRLLGDLRRMHQDLATLERARPDRERVLVTLSHLGEVDVIAAPWIDARVVHLPAVQFENQTLAEEIALAMLPRVWQETFEHGTMRARGNACECKTATELVAWQHELAAHAAADKLLAPNP